MNLRDFCYAHFGWAGRWLSTIFRGMERILDAAYMKVHPEVYLSVVSFVVFLTLMIPLTLSILLGTGLFPNIPFLPLGGILIVPLSTLIPIIIIIIGVIMPKTAASNRIAGLKIEIPYASMYISVMTSGGLSPYESLLRLRYMDLLPNMRNEISRIETIVVSTGADPVTAMERAARVINMNDYKELLLGYASTVRSGGDTLHYLFNQTKTMFSNLSGRIRAMGENMGMLMEAYTIVGILGVLGLFLIFVVGISLPAAGVSISPAQFFLFSFVILPVMSVLFIYFGDTAQISYPVSNWKSFLLFHPPYNLVISIRSMLGFSEGTEAAIGLSLTLIITAVPGLAADFYYTGMEGNLQHGITVFLRDLLETRKSGLSPERCIEALSSREYLGFSKHLRMINMKLSWGYPLRQIYDEFRAKVRNWLALVNIYFLVDTIEVGGGTEESLETLAEFAESTKRLENEKKATLMPLTIVPYIGAALLTATTVMFLQFFTNMSGLGMTIQYVTLYRILLTPLSLHSFILGLVTGKIVSGRVSAGFKHAILLTLVALGGIWAVSNIQLGSVMEGL